jgi:hypothetical protein|tara:strand:+ start:736 stop:1317 length:582 start_codon:yes stop_codon:yes gene_type:complete
MQNKVNIVADDMGNIIRQSSNNAEFGHIRLEQQTVTFGNTGWVKSSNRTTLLHGKMDDLQSLNLNESTPLNGKIIVKESVTPFSNNDPDRDLKIAGETGIICSVDDQPIYRKTFFVADITAQDVLIAHTNGDAIREANGLTSNAVKTTVTPAEAFGLDSPVDEQADVVEEEVEDEVTSEVEEEVLVEEESFEL